MLLGSFCVAQDLHLTQHFLSPLQVNPALTGQFNGCFRMNADYRTQWGSIMGASAFKTISASADMQLLKDKMDGNFFGAGISFFSDKAGDVSYGTTMIAFDGSYCRILNKKKPLTLSAGFHVANWSKTLDVSKITLQNMNGLPSVSNGVSFMDFGLGVAIFHQPIPRIGYNVGFGLYHINSPNQSFEKLSDPLSKKLNLHGSAYIQISDAHTLIPSVLLMSQNGDKQVQFSVLNKILLDDNGSRETAIYFGLGARVASPSVDAMMAYFRVDFYHLSLGLSYDFNVSSLHYSTKNMGGPELAMQYIINCPKSKETIYNKRKKIYCPRF